MASLILLPHADPRSPIRRSTKEILGFKTIMCSIINTAFRLTWRQITAVVNRERPSCVVNFCKRSATVGTCCSQSMSVVLTMLTTPKSTRRWHVTISCQPDGRPQQPVRPWKSGRVHLAEGSNVVVFRITVFYGVRAGQQKVCEWGPKIWKI